MAFLCWFGRHKPSMASITRGKHGGYAALCGNCGRPLERGDKGAWRACAPLYSRDT